MKTREEIERVYDILVDRAQDEFDGRLADIREQRDAALAELDDPMLRLITAAKEVARHPHGEFPHWPNDGLSVTGCVQCAEQKALKSAIDYAEQRRAQDTHVAKDCTWGDACEVASHWQRAQR